MPKKSKVLCVCLVINELGIFYGNQLQGEIYFKHSAKCSQKTNGTFEWTGVGYEKLGGNHA